MRVPSVSDEVLADNWDRIFNKKGFDKQTIDMHEWFFTVLQLNSRG